MTMTPGRASAAPRSPWSMLSASARRDHTDAESARNFLDTCRRRGQLRILAATSFGAVRSRSPAMTGFALNQKQVSVNQLGIFYRTVAGDLYRTVSVGADS
jgi:hypothetical protein